MLKNKYTSFSGISFFIFSLLAAPLQAETIYRINTGFKAPVSNIFRLIIEDAFSQLDLKVDFREVSAQRSLNLANSGVDDGDCCRIAEINQAYPNLLQVPVKIIDIDFVAFSKIGKPPIRGWNDLANYDVGVVRGWKILETGLKKYPVRHVSILSSPRSLFGMLNKERIQVATIGRLVGYKTLANMQLNNIRAHDPPLERKPLYIQLHKKHASLLPRLVDVLKEMQNQGRMTEHYDKVLMPLLKNLDSSTMNPTH